LQARVDEQLYERRLVMSVKYASPGKLDPENSIIEGNDDGMNLLGFNYIPGMKWSDVRNVLVTSAEWPLELEQAIAATAVTISLAIGDLHPGYCQSGNRRPRAAPSICYLRPG
jgi:hypothetical protein